MLFAQQEFRYLKAHSNTGGHNSATATSHPGTTPAPSPPVHPLASPSPHHLIAPHRQIAQIPKIPTRVPASKKLRIFASGFIRLSVGDFISTIKSGAISANDRRLWRDRSARIKETSDARTSTFSKMNPAFEPVTHT